jgi:hypothetical protein
MFCIECGVQIPEHSKFCQHCGTKQSNTVPLTDEKIIEEVVIIEAEQNLVETHDPNMYFQYIKQSLGWYLAWVVLHLGILLICSDAIFTDGSKTDDFWPFVDGKYEGIDEYDIREFLVYTLFPLAILFIRGLVSSNEIDENKTEDHD